MTDYSEWKVKKSVFNYNGDDEEKKAESEAAHEEYSKVAQWCNDGQKYHIEETRYYYEVVANPTPTPPTDEEIRQMRERAYTQEVDPITAHIQRLRDMEQTEEVKAEIAELIAERDIKVQEIKQRYPYNEEPDENI